MKYNWQRPEWPKFEYRNDDFEKLLLIYLQRAGMLEGTLRSLSESDRMDSILELLVLEAIKSSEIEGEFLSRKDVKSSIKKNLGLSTSVKAKDQKAIGIAKLMTSARQTFNSPLTEKMLLDWHRAVLSHDSNIAVGQWRSHEDPMQIVSGAFGKEKVHFEAPPSKRVPKEMKQFIKWFNDTAPKAKKEIIHAPVRAAIAHIYFESIHPFEDGNGRIGRAIAEKALAQTTGYPGLTSLSIIIEKNKKEYYNQLEKGQRSNDITGWLNYFITTVVSGQEYAQRTVDYTLKKTMFFDRFKDQLNDTQLKVINKMFAEGPTGFQGGMTAEKYLRIGKVSKATATRHLQDLLKLKAFKVTGQGRATRYNLNL